MGQKPLGCLIVRKRKHLVFIAIHVNTSQSKTSLNEYYLKKIEKATIYILLLLTPLNLLTGWTFPPKVDPPSAENKLFLKIAFLGIACYVNQRDPQEKGGQNEAVKKSYPLLEHIGSDWNNAIFCG